MGEGRNERRLLNGATTTVGADGLCCITGPSGAGKSTILRVIAGLFTSWAGYVGVNGTDLADLSARRRRSLRRHTVALIHQEFNLFTTLTAAENVSLALELRGVGRRDAERAAREELERFGLETIADYFPATLSGGEQQRVAIARSTVGHVPVVLADEPTGSLDQESATVVVDCLSAIAEQGRCCIVVTHNPAVAERATRVIKLENELLVEC